MTPLDFDRWQRICGLGDVPAAKVLGITAERYLKWKNNALSDVHPSGLTYAFAWIILYGHANPWPVEELPEQLRRTLTKLKIRTAALSMILGAYSGHMFKWKRGELVAPAWVGFALAWVLLYGIANPFPDAAALGYRRCPTCGR